ncbi:triphosphoribosyl-dephospho-CoA synthase [Cronobacter sakazakii]|uniref:triphosphoribosyl-dephospho-CoA synthase n=1 Tax=Cronobacter sakazakii TaxID=28141 RepID=UPI001EFC7908|nr:triphosphoribosyl-dephospho-CoA synthase [Cronobacter sakazakii]
MTGLPATDRRSVRQPDVPSLAVAALYDELNLTPKPGLVDCANSGACWRRARASFAASSSSSVTPGFTGVSSSIRYSLT